MSSAKDVRLKPISAKDANRFILRHHYSGKVVQNSQLHLGAFLNGKLEGAMQFGPGIAKKGQMKLVEGTKWNGFIELNRMAFSDKLPRNSESRCIGYAMRLLKKHYPQLEWVISFADGTQCGDGTIYRASGFYLTDIRINDRLRINPETGEPMHSVTAYHAGPDVEKRWATWKPLKGYQLRYIYFLNPAAKDRLTVPILPFSRIDEMKARMYKGKQPYPKRAGSVDSDTPAIHAGEGGANPTPALHSSGVSNG